MMEALADAIATTNVLDWVERMGGWAVVCFIVWWLTGRWERRMEVQANRIRGLADAMREQTTKYGDLGTKLLSNQAGLQSGQSTILTELGRIEEQRVKQTERQTDLAQQMAATLQTIASSLNKGAT